MSDSSNAASAIAALGDSQLVIFDGIFLLCRSSVQFIIARDPMQEFAFAQMQSDYARALLSEHPLGRGDLDTLVLFKHGKCYQRSNAVFEIARGPCGPWRPVTLFKYLPRVCRDSIYKVLSTHR